MKTQLAFHNLTYQSAKTLVSVGGVAFALLLVFMQLGFMGAVSHTAVNVYQHMRFDALIRSPDYLHLYEPLEFENRWLQVAKGTPGVKDVAPMWITLHNWGSLRATTSSADTGAGGAAIDGTFAQFLPIAVMGIRPIDDVFDLKEVREQVHFLADTQSVLIDSATRSDYGPIDGQRFSIQDKDRDSEIGGVKVKIQGIFHLGTGLAANGAALTGVRCFQRLVPWDCEKQISLGLVTTDGSRPVSEVLQDLRGRIASSGPGASVNLGNTSKPVHVLSRNEVMQWERMRWLSQTPIGLIFQLGVGLSLLVGAAIVYMVLATDVVDRLPEYATLLAIGYSRAYLAGIVMTQAIVLACLGFLAAWLASELLYRLTSWLSGIPIAMNASRVVLVAGLGLLMCCASGLLAMNKLWKAEPASLF